MGARGRDFPHQLSHVRHAQNPNRLMHGTKRSHVVVRFSDSMHVSVPRHMRTTVRICQPCVPPRNSLNSFGHMPLRLSSISAIQASRGHARARIATSHSVSPRLSCTTVRLLTWDRVPVHVCAANNAGTHGRGAHNTHHGRTAGCSCVFCALMPTPALTPNQTQTIAPPNSNPNPNPNPTPNPSFIPPHRFEVIPPWTLLQHTPTQTPTPNRPPIRHVASSRNIPFRSVRPQVPALRCPPPCSQLAASPTSSPTYLPKKKKQTSSPARPQQPTVPAHAHTLGADKVSKPMLRTGMRAKQHME